MLAISNVRWIGLSQASRITSQLIALIVLSRLLPPSDFGLMAMATVVINFAFLLRDMGTAAAIIQKEILTEETTNTVFWLNISLGVAISITLLVLAVPISYGFKSPELIPVLMLLALVFPIASSSAVHQAMLERKSKFKLLARIEIMTSILSLFIGLSLAYNGYGVFSLVFQTLSASILSTLQLWKASTWLPKFKWSMTEFISLLRFSGNLTGFNFINFFARNSDSIIIGRILGAMPLGIYSQAYKVMMFPLQSMTSVVNRALFPIMSRQQNNINEMSHLYFRSLGIVATITAPLMAGLWILRVPFISVVLGEQWQEVAVILSWLAPVGFIQSITSTTGTVFMATGRTDILLKLGIVGATLQVCGFFLGARWGIKGVAICYLIANVINLLPCFYYTLKQLRCNSQLLFSVLWRPIALSFAMLTGIYFIQKINFIENQTQLVALISMCIIGAALYTILIFFISPTTISDFKKIVRRSN